ncbi:metal ABC transporter ATP-binding protein [Oscillatoria salina]|uniref:metal ABC transporter ATP-binding protein n=1 Tax=Oscillatoria salina TaxID=331517 RepID=UPI001CCD6963|nr:metal ABC transporter ATP-binding protein [Oscillatoria salina]MBZ8182591.1 metal ABC transporter ATP-binding protein [Oscillatoria salina IIICB1]
MKPSNSSDLVIAVKNLWAGYEQNDVLQGIDFFVRELDYIGIIGPNGGGKTTLFKVLLGLLAPQRGQVKILGLEAKQGRRYIGYVPQIITFDRSFPIDVWDVVRMGRLGKRRLLSRFNRQDDEKVEQALRQVDLLDLRHRSVSELSGGQLQRVYLARALATEPRILLLDEPTASLDSRASTAIYDLLEEINSYVTILTISHDIGAISSQVKTVGCLNQKLYYHGDRQITNQMLEQAYGSTIEQVVHSSVPQRILDRHDTEG